MASTEILLELGDFIKIISPTKPMYHLNIFLVDYIDDDVIDIIDMETADKFSLDLYDDGRIMDEHILSIHLLSRSDEPGYARQHGLLPGHWINIEFAADLDLTIMGQIVELIEDRIKVLPKNDIKTPMYIDFAYQGIPKTIPITKISTIDIPSVQESLSKISALEADIEGAEGAEGTAFATLDTTPTGDVVINMPPNATVDRNMFDVIKDIYVQADAIVFGKTVKVEIEEEVGRAEQRYGIEIQTNNLLDELLSTIPSHLRTPPVMERVKRIISRFRELRAEYSIFDEYGNVQGSKNFNAAYKPLVEQLKTNCGVRWILPVSNQELKIYNIPENNLVESQSLADDLTVYKNAVEANDSDNRYATFYKRIDEIFKPYIGPSTAAVGDNIEAIITSLDDYSAAVYKKYKSGAKLAKQRFVIQRYNLGTTKISKQLMRNGKTVYVREQITEPDKINATTVVLLPQPMIELSRTNLPGTDILTRTNLGQNWLYYFRILNKKTQPMRINMTSAAAEIDYESIAENPFMTHIIDYGKSGLSYQEFLRSAIPRSVAIIRMLKPETNKYNFHDIVASFEPFLIYKDNITYSGRLYGERAKEKQGGPYQEIRTHIIKKMKDYNIRHEDKRREYAQLATIKSEKMSKPALLSNVPNDMILDRIVKYYKLDDKMTDTDILTKVVAADGGRAYTSLIAYIMASLYTPELALIEDKTDSAITNSKSCVTRVIAKKYTSTSALSKDNGKEELYFDREYDNTPYKLLDKYKGEQKAKTPEDFLEYFRVVLIAKHGARPDLAKDMAETIIAKRKQIQHGNYAVLVEYPQPSADVDIESLGEEESKSILAEADMRKRIHYYVRKNNHWIKDAKLSDQELSDEMFCNVENKCFYDSLAASCDSESASAKRMKAIARKSIGGEYEATIKMSLVDYQHKVRVQLENGLTDLKRLQRIRADKREQFTRMAYRIGTTAVINEVVVSPYAELFSLILKQGDFTKKQYDIRQFKDLYCREAVENDVANESQYWYYCTETNVKLMPTFIYILAKTFTSGGNYDTMSQWLCGKFGRLSDDGEAIVDKHSGYVIKQLDYSAEEGFNDAGFRIETNAVLDPDEYELVRELIGKKDSTISSKSRVFENDTNAFIYSVSNAICDNMDIRYDDLEADIMNHTNTFLIRKTMSRDVYEAKMSKIDVKDGKKQIPYEKYLNKNIVLYTAAITFMLIQAHVPSYKPRKSFPGCKYSLTGFPLNVDGDTSGLTYLGCILNTMKSKTAEPWKSVYKSDQTGADYTSMVTDIIKSKLVDEREIAALYNIKRDYLKLTPDLDDIPKELGISKWVFFQPPLNRVDVSNKLTGLAAGYKTELDATVKRGHASQHDLLGTMYKKIIEHSYAVNEEINAVVAVEGHDAMLKAGTVVFLENACCDESFQKSIALDYFVGRKPVITKNIDFVREYGQLYSEFAKLATPAYLSTGHKRPIPVADTMMNRFSEDAIYGAYIHYCKLDSELPIPYDVVPFCQEKPPGLENMSRAQMIDHLKETSHTQSEASLAHLMKLVSHRNRVAVSYGEEKVPRFMDHFSSSTAGPTSGSTAGPTSGQLDPLIAHIHEFISGKKSVSVLAEYLTEINSTMKDTIVEYIRTFSSRSASGITRITKYLAEFMSWKNTQMTHDFIRGSVFMLSRVLPAMLEDTTNTVGLKNMNAMKHWDFSQKHQDLLAKMIVEYYQSFNLFRRDELICKLFSVISKSLYSLNVLLEHLPAGLSDVILNKVYTYCYYSVFYEVITESDKDTYAKLNVEIVKSARRLEEVDVVPTDNRQFKESICELATIMLETDMKNKAIVDLNYEMLTENFHKAKMREKNKIIEDLGRMDPDARKIEDLMKTYKLGKWNLGEQRGIFQYDKALQDTELDELLLEPATDVAMDAEGLDQLVRHEAQAEEDAEVNNMDIGEDYMNGNYYDEDRDRDFE